MMFAGPYRAPHLAEGGPTDDEDLMQRLLRMLATRGDRREQQDEDQTRRRMAALAGIPKAEAVEKHVRKQERKDRLQESMPARVVGAHLRGAAPRPDGKTLTAAGISEQELDRRRDEDNKQRQQRLLRQKEEKYQRGTHGSATINGKTTGGEKISSRERRELSRRIDELRALLGMESY